jgi:hypothetical protein
MLSSPSIKRIGASPSAATFLRTLSGIACLCLVACTGCSQAQPEHVPVYPATGTITLKGQPMPGAFIALHPKNPQENVPTPRADVGKDGAFKVTTFAGGDGAPEGTYVVTVQWNKLVKNGSDLVAGPNVAPSQYSKPETSKLEVRIAAGQNQIPPIKL